MAEDCLTNVSQSPFYVVLSIAALYEINPQFAHSNGLINLITIGLTKYYS